MARQRNGRTFSRSTGGRTAHDIARESTIVGKHVTAAEAFLEMTVSHRRLDRHIPFVTRLRY